MLDLILEGLVHVAKTLDGMVVVPDKERAERKAWIAKAEATLAAPFPLPVERVLSGLVIRATENAPLDSGWMIGPYGAKRIVAVLRSHGFLKE